MTDTVSSSFVNDTKLWHGSIEIGGSCQVVSDCCQFTGSSESTTLSSFVFAL